MATSARARILRTAVLVIASSTAMIVAEASREASAQSAEQRAVELDQQARAAFERGDFRQAAQRFQEACLAAPHPATRYNEAMAWERAGEPARAADAYERVLASEGLDAERVGVARERLAELDRSLAVLSIRQPVGGAAAAAHVIDARIPLRAHLQPGTHEVRIREANGNLVIRSVEASAGKVVELVIELAAARPVSSAIPGPAASAATASPAASPSRTWAWVALGGAGALSLTAGFLGLRTLDSLQEYEDSGYRDAELRDRTQRYKLLTNVAWGAAALSGSIGVVLLLSGKGPERGGREHATQVRLAPGSIVLGGAF